MSVPRSSRVLLLVALAAGSAAAAPTARPRAEDSLLARPAPSPNKLGWTYRLEATDEQGSPRRAREIVLLQGERRRASGGEIIPYVVEVDGALAGGEALEALGLGERPPGPVFSVMPTLQVSILRHPGGSTVTLFDGAASDQQAALAEPLARWRLSDERKKMPKRIPADRAYSYGRKVGSWQSVCQAYAHPSPETGDYFEWERCYTHGVGITFLKYLSAWGSYKLELVRGEARDN